jgi:FkbM family methyltransferase
MAGRFIDFGGRSARSIARAPFEPAHYRAFAGMVASYPDFFDNLRRYLTGAGSYPYECRIRTPEGIVAPTLYSRHDVVTATEIFCRLDYGVGESSAVAVDVGSNIGLSGLYFLSRNRSSRVYCFEPDPRNIERLERNLSAYGDRFVVDPVAVAPEEGTVTFGTEPTGRYGRIASDFGDPIQVPCRDINRILAEILEREPKIDVLKIDTEGNEEALVSAIRSDLLDRIETIFYETAGSSPLHLDRFEHRYRCQVNRLRRLDAAPQGA